MGIDLHGYHPSDIVGSGMLEQLVQQAWEMGESRLGLIHGGVPGKSCTSGGKANWYERSLVCHEERSMRRNRS
jgi:hypothetical protein